MAATLLVINNSIDARAVCINCGAGSLMDFTAVGGDRNTAVLCENCHNVFFLSANVANFCNCEFIPDINPCAYQTDYNSAVDFANYFRSNIMDIMPIHDTTRYFISPLVRVTHVGVNNAIEGNTFLNLTYPTFFRNTDIKMVKQIGDRDVAFIYYETIPPLVYVYKAPEGAYEASGLISNFDFIGYCMDCNCPFASQKTDLLNIPRNE